MASDFYNIATYALMSNYFFVFSLLSALGFIALVKGAARATRFGDAGFDDFSESQRILAGYSLSIAFFTVYSYFFRMNGWGFQVIMAAIAILGAVSMKGTLRTIVKYGVIFNASSFYIAASASLYGGINVFHDGFTYISLAQWNAQHAFREPADITSAMATQAALYQIHGFRMGAISYFAGLFALSKENFSVAIYPVWLQIGIFMSALAAHSVGRVLNAPSRTLWLMVLAIVSGPGIYYFSTQAGFIPQLYGGAFLLGLFSLLLSARFLGILAGGASAPRWYGFMAGAYISGVIVCYSEMIPLLVFLCAAFAILGLFAAWRREGIRWGQIAAVLVTCVPTIILTANVQLYRAIVAILAQSGAVVGWDVQWGALGFLAFAVGVKQGVGGGGAQVLFPHDVILTVIALIPLLYMALKGGAAASALRRGILCVSFALGMIALFVVLKRNSVEDPDHFVRWGFFKLAGWGGFFLTSLIAASVAMILRQRVWVAACICAIFFAFALKEVRPHANFRTVMGGQSYADWASSLREKVNAAAPSGQCVSLIFPDGFFKVREYAAYALYPRETYADWGDDGYIVSYVPARNRHSNPECVQIVGSEGPNGAVDIMIEHDINKIPLVLSYKGGSYDQEGDKDLHWVWMRNKADYEILNASGSAGDAELRFSFIAGGAVTIHINIPGKFDGDVAEVGPGTGSYILPFHLNEGEKSVPMTIYVNGAAAQLSPQDTRIATGRLVNIEARRLKPTQ